MSRILKIVLPVIVVISLLIGVGLWRFFRDDAPAEVSLDVAIAELAEGSDVGGSTGVADESSTFDDATGTWVVDTASGDFDYESASGTFAGFRIEEELSGIGSNTAVGRTGEVTGTVEIDGTTVTSAIFGVDVASITTNDSRRDDQVDRTLEPDEYPTATFTLATPMALGSDAINGEPVTVSAVGALSIHGVTHSVTVELEAQLIRETIVIAGSTPITFADFDVEIPESPIVLSVDESGTLEFQLLLVRQ